MPDQANPDHSTHDLLTIQFGGLCAFVDDVVETDDETTKVTHALLVAAEHSSVRPRLCLHSSILLFSAAELAGLVGGAHHPTFVDGEGNVRCAFDLTGCEVEILPDGLDPSEENPHHVQPISADASYRHVLDLTRYAAGVDRGWITGGIHPEGLVSARFKLSHGRLSCSQRTEKPWEMVLPGDEHTRNGTRLGQLVSYSLEGRTKPSYTELRITNHRTGGQQTLRFHPDASLGVSSLCTYDAVQIRDERDVFAYYELSSDPLPMAHRHRPVLATEDVRPGQSACPPVRQST